jgi:hypothetical protein
VAMYQCVRITVCGDVSVDQITVCDDVLVCSDYSMWRCISVFKLQSVAMYLYDQITVCGDVSV